MSDDFVPLRIVIVGGGIAGLSTAHRALELSSALDLPIEVLVLETGCRLGGVVHTESLQDCLIEAGPDSFVADTPWGIRLCERLNLTDELIRANPHCRRSFVVRNAQLLPVPFGFSLLGPERIWPFATSRVLSPAGKLRAVSEVAVPRRRDSSDESVASFVRRRFGRELYERLAEPIVRGIASGNPDELSMRALLPEFMEMERCHGSVIHAMRIRAKTSKKAESEAIGARYDLYVSFREGMQTLIDRLAEALPREGLRLNAHVNRIEQGFPLCNWRVCLAGGETIEADAVCLALPACRASEVVRYLDGKLSCALSEIRYASWITLNLAFQRSSIAHPLDGFGFAVPSTEHMPIVGCTFSHVKFPGRSPEGIALLRAFIQYEDGHCPSDSDAESAVCRTLSRLIGIKDAPLGSVVHRFPTSLPHYRLGHKQRILAIRERLASHKGLSLAGNAYAGHGISECIRSGKEAAEDLLETLRAGVSRSAGTFAHAASKG